MTSAAVRHTDTLHATSIAELVLRQGQLCPERAALVLGDRRVGFGALCSRIESFAAGLRAAGLPRGARVMLLAPPDDEIYALALAALATGMSLVLLDGRLSRPRLLAALHDAAPDVVVAPAAVLRWWPLVGALRRARRIVTTGRMLGAHPLASLAGNASAMLARPAAAADDPAFVSFTSATTGRAKAVVRTHAVLLAQHDALVAAFPMDDGANLPGFPAGTLHNLCCGVTSVIPTGDLRAMADSDPAAVLARMEAHGVTSLSGAPEFLRRLSAHVAARGAPVTSIRRVVVGGGPVGRALAGAIVRAFPRAVAHVVYGATEAEPIASAPLREVVSARGAGFLVGAPVPGTELLLLAPDGTPAGTGEVTVRGAHVVGGSWHRTGDVARMDAQGRLWLLGRVGGAVGPARAWPYVAEAAAHAVAGVRAAAHVSHSRAPDGELLVQCEAGSSEASIMDELRGALLHAGSGSLPVRAVSRIPMDARHASKVSRAELLDGLERERR